MLRTFFALDVFAWMRWLTSNQAGNDTNAHSISGRLLALPTCDPRGVEANRVWASGTPVEGKRRKNGSTLKKLFDKN